MFALCCACPSRSHTGPVPAEAATTGSGSANEPRRDSSPADGAARRRRSMSSIAAAATAALNSRRCRLPSTTGTRTETADTAVNARKIHIPVTTASPVPIASGRAPASIKAALLLFAAGLLTTNGAETSVPAELWTPGAKVPQNTRDIDEPPHRIMASDERAAACTLFPLTLIPLALPRSSRVTAESETSSCACSRDNSVSGTTISVPLRPIRNRPRRRGTTRPAPGPLCTASTKPAASGAAAGTAPSIRTAPSTKTAPSTRGRSPTVSAATGTRSTVSSRVP